MNRQQRSSGGGMDLTPIKRAIKDWYDTSENKVHIFRLVLMLWVAFWVHIIIVLPNLVRASGSVSFVLYILIVPWSVALYFLTYWVLTAFHEAKLVAGNPQYLVDNVVHDCALDTTPITSV